MIKAYNISDSCIRVICGHDSINESTYLVDYKPLKENSAKAEYLDSTKPVFLVDGKRVLTLEQYLFVPKEIWRYSYDGGKAVIRTERTVDGERSFVENAKKVKIADSYEAEIEFAISDDEAIYGLGQQENGIFNYRGVTEYLYHNNMKIPMPVFVSSKKYAVFFDSACMITYSENDNKIHIKLDATDKIDFYLIAGECMDDIIAGIRALTGHNAMLPRWTYGYIQSKERYKTQQEIIETVEKFKKEGIPLSCIVLDWLSWEDGKWGNKIFDKSRFPEVKEMVEKLHSDGVRFMLSIWPNCKEGCENHTEFAEKAKLLCNYSTYDAFDEEARDIYWNQLEKELYKAGTDAWWCDSTEPFTPDWNGTVKKPDAERFEMAKESTNMYLDARYSSAYCLMHAKGVFEHQKAQKDGRRIVNLTRAGYPGIQKYGTILWSGDIAATWDTFKNQIAEGLSMGLSGIANWTWDTGAFFTGNTKCWRKWCNKTEGEATWFWQGDFEDGVDDKGYKELYVRWLQAATFLPIMRSHGTDTPREPWHFGKSGDKYYDTIVRYIKLRYSLLPYTYSLAAFVALEDYTMMRALIFDYPQDKKAGLITDSFMFGPSFYVCPVTEPLEYGPQNTAISNPMRREVYLPEGNDWYDFSTGRQIMGGQTIMAEAPLEFMPVFVKAGSIIPMSAGTDGSVDEIVVYPGADSSFVLYEDEGDSYAYEKKEYRITVINWNEKNQKIRFQNSYGDDIQTNAKVTVIR